jgi:CcmD family protein
MQTNMISLAIIPLIVWVGIFFYLLMVDKKLSRIEREQEIDDL